MIDQESGQHLSTTGSVRLGLDPLQLFRGRIAVADIEAEDIALDTALLPSGNPVKLDDLRIDAVPAAMERIFSQFDMIVSSHKIGGPKGAGALIARGEALMPRPLIQGGGQERGHRSGTQNSLALIGFGAAAEAASDELEARNATIGALRERLEAGMISTQGSGNPAASGSRWPPPIGNGARPQEKRSSSSRLDWRKIRALQTQTHWF